MFNERKSARRIFEILFCNRLKLSVLCVKKESIPITNIAINYF